MSSKPSYNEIYLLMCDELRETAERILERPLTAQELAHIYNAGSLMMLESVGRGIEAGSKENLSETLISASFVDRLAEIKRTLPKTLEDNFLGQAVSQQLVEKLNQLPYVYTVFQVMLRMEQTPEEARYQELTHILDELI
ncbi:MAG: hypothetical protein GC179_06160 [Anaerolineaceae bacterium]|nr:hypothetical protein [Anaerolineaceae bacterium]